MIVFVAPDVRRRGRSPGWPTNECYALAARTRTVSKMAFLTGA